MGVKHPVLYLLVFAGSLLTVLAIGSAWFPFDPVNRRAFEEIQEGMAEEELEVILGRAPDQEFPGHQMVQPAGGAAPRIQCWWGFPQPIDRLLGPNTGKGMLAVGLAKDRKVEWKIFYERATTHNPEIPRRK